jgi:hypothetical protein
MFALNRCSRNKFKDKFNVHEHGLIEDLAAKTDFTAALR